MFQLECRPSGFTQSAMRYPPRSPDITINTKRNTCLQQFGTCRLCGTSSRTDPRPKTTIPPHAFAASAEPTPDNSPQHIYLYLPFLFNCMTMHEVEVGGVSQETLTRRFPRLHFYGCSAGGLPGDPYQKVPATTSEIGLSTYHLALLGTPPTTWPSHALLCLPNPWVPYPWIRQT